MEAWVRTVDFFCDPLLLQNANVFALLTEVQSPQGITLGDIAGFAYGYKYQFPLLNPDHDVHTQNEASFTERSIHRTNGESHVPTVSYQPAAFIRKVSDQAVQSSRI